MPPIQVKEKITSHLKSFQQIQTSLYAVLSFAYSYYFFDVHSEEENNINKKISDNIEYFIYIFAKLLI